jgi:hypothetical protein
MPTAFSTCIECVHYTCFDISHKCNSKYRSDLEKQDILMEYGLPKEIAQKIIYMNQSFRLCTFCKYSKLCDIHGYYYGVDDDIPQVICGTCLWDKLMT